VCEGVCVLLFFSFLLSHPYGELALTSSVASECSYAPWCSHCKDLRPIFAKVAYYENRKDDDVVHLGAVDCIDSNNLMLCKRFAIGGFPTLILYVPCVKVADVRCVRASLSLARLPPGRNAVRITDSLDRTNRRTQHNTLFLPTA
jgi:thiol-disulfide isomerase/thioredoxin